MDIRHCHVGYLTYSPTFAVLSSEQSLSKVFFRAWLMARLLLGLRGVAASDLFGRLSV